MYDRVLLPTDCRDGPEPALDHAIELALAFDAPLSVLSVIDDAADQPVDVDAVEHRRREALEAVADRVQRAGVEVEIDVRHGAPHAEILDYAAEVDADLLVMGTHGRSGVDRVLLGSVAERVLRRAPVPVVTVRLDAGPAGVTTPDAAIDSALDALSAEGYDDAEVADDPFRTTGTWVVPARTSEGVFNVHVDAADGSARVAKLGG